MNATIISNNEKHYPVLLDEILSIISPQNGGTFIDCTFGQGGYSKAILKFPKTKIFALDRDIYSEKYANELKDKNQNRFFFHGKSLGIDRFLTWKGIVFGNNCTHKASPILESLQEQTCTPQFLTIEKNVEDDHLVPEVRYHNPNPAIPTV